MNQKIRLVIAGQSNGVSPNNNSLKPQYSRTGRVEIAHNFSTEAINSIPITDNPINYSITWLFLGDMINRLTGKDVRIINVSHGNTNSVDWNNLYSDELGLTCEIEQPDAVLWIQGESDTNQGITQSQSEPAYENIITKAKQGCSNVPFFIALNSHNQTLTHDADGNTLNPQNPEDMPIRKTQRRMLIQNLAFQGPDIDAMRKENQYWFEYVSHNTKVGSEFKGVGLIEHAKCWNNVLYDWYSIWGRY